jgi:hypothetical protein
VILNKDGVPVEELPVPPSLVQYDDDADDDEFQLQQVGQDLMEGLTTPLSEWGRVEVDLGEAA